MFCEKTDVHNSLLSRNFYSSYFENFKEFRLIGNLLFLGLVDKLVEFWFFLFKSFLYYCLIKEKSF